MNKKLLTLAWLATIGLTSLAQAVQYGTVSNAVQTSSGCLMVSDDAPSKIPASAVFGDQQRVETSTEQVTASPAKVSVKAPSEPQPAQAPARKASNTTTAPMPVTDLTADFPNGSLTGTVSFTMPTKQVNGRNLLPNAPLTYIITATSLYGYTLHSSTIRKTDFAVPGEQINCVLNLPESANYQIDVYIYRSDDKTNSDSEFCQYLVGEKPPQFARRVRLEKVIGSNRLHLFWELEGMGPGIQENLINDCYYYNPDSVTFQIYRNPGNVMVANNYKEEEFFEDILDTTLVGYSYIVKVFYRGGEAKPRFQGLNVSNRIAIGKAKPLPFEQQYSKDEFNKWTVLNGSIANPWRTNENNGYFSKHQAYGDNNWLISPPIEFTEGAYRLTYLYREHDNADGKIENPNIETYFMNEPIDIEIESDIIPYKLPNTDNYISVFKVNRAHDGKGYFGFHCVYGDVLENIHQIHLENLRLEKIASVTSPDSVTMLRAEQVNSGAREICISCLTPSNDISGNPISTIKRIHFYRNSQLIETINVSGVETRVSIIDGLPNEGWNLYSVVCEGADGALGLPNICTSFAGLDQPKDVEKVKMQITGGNVVLTWKPVDIVGVNEHPIGNVSYSIMDRDYNIIKSNIVDTIATLANVDLKGSPRYLRYYVIATNDKYSSPYWIGSNATIIGDAIVPPIYESFKNGEKDNIGFVRTSTYLESASIKDQDDALGGKGYLALTGHENGTACYSFQIIDMSSVNNPFISFYLVGGEEQVSQGSLQVGIVKNYTDDIIMCGDSITYESLGDKKWHYVEIPLENINSCNNVQVWLIASGSYGIDEIHIWDKKPNDLELRVTNIPEKVRIGESKDIQFEVWNYGDEIVEANEWTMRVYKGNDLLMALPSADLQPQSKIEYSISALGQVIENLVQYRLVADWKYDYNQLNNNVDIAIPVVMPSVPEPLNLSGDEIGGKSSLIWNSPQCEGMYDKLVIDNVESYGDENFGGVTKDEHEGHLGDWTIFAGNTSDCISWTPFGERFMSWACINVDSISPMHSESNDFTAHSGSHVFYSQSVLDEWDEGIETNHWLVTPKLNGKSQTLSFWVKNTATTVYNMEYLWLGTTNAESLASNPMFYHLGEDYIRATGHKWKKYSFDIPEGTTFVCFRHVTQCLTYAECLQSAILLDDIEFTVEADASELEVMDYTVYRDNKVIATGVTDTHYVDAVPRPGVYRYRVSANYAEAGESPLSNEVELFIINTPGPDDPNSALDDLAADGTIVVRPVEGGVQVRNASGEVLSVYNVAGQLMGRVVAHSDLETIALSPGMYLVTAGNKVGKVLVR